VSGPYPAADNASFCAKQPDSFFFSSVSFDSPSWMRQDQTALMISAGEGHLEISKLLVEYKADVDARSEE
jgi:ankyrin repeat protein